MRHALIMTLMVGLASCNPTWHRPRSVSEDYWKERFHKAAIKLRKMAKELTALSSSRQMPSCGICSWAAGKVLKDIRSGMSEDLIADNLSHECKLVGIAGTDRVCDGLVKNFRDEFFYVMKRTTLSASQICSSVLGEECGDKEAFNWTITLPPRRKSQQKPRKPKQSALVLRFLHISDTHVDFRYSEGSRADCPEPLCCREEHGKANWIANVPAGRWGSLGKCDLPSKTFENMLQNVHKHHKIDYVIWTGDMVPHDVWNTSRESNLAITKYTADAIAKFLPGVPVFPAVGNHEGHPANCFAPPEQKGKMSASWIFGALAQQWSRWLPSSATATVRRAGFYSARPFPGLKVISLNTNYCSSLNWWLLINATDPAQQLEWLVNELEESETKREKHVHPASIVACSVNVDHLWAAYEKSRVMAPASLISSNTSTPKFNAVSPAVTMLQHCNNPTILTSVQIIAHIAPASSDCLHTWSDNYHRILERFESTVQGQFFGHSHADELKVAYDSRHKKRAIGVSYLAPSLTTYGSGHPAFRIFTVDGGYKSATWSLLDHHTYLLDLSVANAHPDQPPKWELEYSARSAYNMPNLEPQQWDKVLRKMEHDDALFNKFYKFYRKGAPEKKRCGASCRKKLLCEQMTARSSDLKLC